jgi:hypothetical protein
MLRTFSQIVIAEEMHEKYGEINTVKELIRCFYDIFYMEDYDLRQKKELFISILVDTNSNLLVHAENIWLLMVNLPDSPGNEGKLINDIEAVAKLLEDIVKVTKQAQSLS